MRGVFLAVFAACVIGLSAQAQPPNRGPATVTIAPVREGVLAPGREETGTIFFKEMSEVATEVAGKVVDVAFEEGEVVTAGSPLVKLDASLLQRELAAAEATHQRYLTEQEDARVRYERAKLLIKDLVTTPEQYDILRFGYEAKRHEVTSSDAEVERIRTLIDKYTIRAPFDGIILSRETELGEWKSSGDVVAKLARQNIYDIIVNVPQDILAHLQPGTMLPLNIAGKEFRAEVVAMIPQGDITTRTFPVKLRLEEDVALYEGMAAKVSVPTGEPRECLFVPRDAVLRVQGEETLFTIDDGKAHRHRVEVLGYEGLMAGIVAPDLSTGEKVIVKGHERLRDGDVVHVVGEAFSTGGATPIAADG